MKGVQTARECGGGVKETDKDTGKAGTYSIPPTRHPPTAQNGKGQWGLENDEGQRRGTEGCDFRSEGPVARRWAHTVKPPTLTGWHGAHTDERTSSLSPKASQSSKWGRKGQGAWGDMCLNGSGNGTEGAQRGQREALEGDEVALIYPAGPGEAS